MQPPECWGCAGALAAIQISYIVPNVTTKSIQLPARTTLAQWESGRQHSDNGCQWLIWTAAQTDTSLTIFVYVSLGFEMRQFHLGLSLLHNFICMHVSVVNLLLACGSSIKVVSTKFSCLTCTISKLKCETQMRGSK